AILVQFIQGYTLRIENLDRRIAFELIIIAFVNTRHTTLPDGLLNDVVAHFLADQRVVIWCHNVPFWWRCSRWKPIIHKNRSYPCLWLKNLYRVAISRSKRSKPLSACVGMWFVFVLWYTLTPCLIMNFSKLTILLVY